MTPARSARVLAVLEGLGLNADDLAHLAALARKREREHAEEHTAELAEVMWDRPTIGALRARRKESGR